MYWSSATKVFGGNHQFGFGHQGAKTWVLHDMLWLSLFGMASSLVWGLGAADLNMWQTIIAFHHLLEQPFSISFWRP